MAVSKGELKRHREKVAQILRGFSVTLERICRAFNTNRSQPPVTREERARLGPDGALFKWISEGLAEELNEQEIAELLRIRSVLAFVRGVQRPIDELMSCVERKINEQVLFSDRAVREVNDLFGKSRFLVQAAADGVLTENPILKSHAVCGVDFLFQLLERYADDHQKRLISGVCRPKASVIYLDMHENFRGLLHHLKEIAQHISAEVELETWACPLDKPTEGGAER